MIIARTFHELRSFSNSISNQTLLIATATTFLIFVFVSNKKRRRLPPGPWALPVIGHLHLLGPLIHQSMQKLSAQYGPFMYLRLGSIPCIVASSPELAKELLKTHELAFAARRQTAAVRHLTYNAAFAFAPYGPYWKLIKKLSQTDLLGSKSLNQSLPIRTEELQQFLRLIYQRSLEGKTVNLSKKLSKLTNNVISHMMLSIRCSGTDRQAEEFKALAREVTRIFGEFNVSDFIWLCKNIDLQGFRVRFREIRRRYDALLEKIIKDREELRKTRKSVKGSDGDEGKEDEENMSGFLDMMLDILEDETVEIKITRDHIKALVLDFLTAGTDTSAVSVEWALSELINNPPKMEKAREEILNNIGTDRLVQESDIRSLPYIQAIFKETFRLHPPIPLVTRESLQQCVVKGYTIPAGTMLFVNTWAIGRDPNVWDNPLKFKPERFLPNGNDPNAKGVGEIDIKGQHFELLPFGSGRRGCPGISLAMLELPTTLAALIQCFDWKVKGDSVDMAEGHGLTVPKANELICTPIPRLTSLLESLSS